MGDVVDIRFEAANLWLPDRLEPLVAEARAEHMRIPDRVVNEWRAGSQRYTEPGELLLVAAADKRPIAVGGMTRCPVVDGALRMRRFYVAPSWRRHGIGRQLAAKLIEHGMVHALMLTCNAQASAAAAPFWESLGFRPAGKVPGITHVRTTRRCHPVPQQ